MTDEVAERRSRLDKIEDRLTMLETRLENMLDIQEQVNNDVMEMLRMLSARVEHPSRSDGDDWMS